MDNKRKHFLAILESHKGLIYKIVNSYCKYPDEKDDLTQEIIVQLWLSFDKFNNTFKYSTWIYRISLNTSISFYRKRKRIHANTIALSPVIELSLNEADNQISDILDDEIQLLHNFIHKLKELDKALILLYLDGLSQIEMAEITGISPTNVSTRILRIKKKLKDQFKNAKS